MQERRLLLSTRSWPVMVLVEAMLASMAMRVMMLIVPVSDDVDFTSIAFCHDVFCFS